MIRCNGYRIPSTSQPPCVDCRQVVIALDFPAGSLKFELNVSGKLSVSVMGLMVDKAGRYRNVAY